MGPSPLPALHRVERDRGVDAKREGLVKVGPVDEAEVDAADDAAEDLPERLGRRVGGHAERAGIVVARAERDDAEARAAAHVDLHEAVHDLVNDAVTAQGKHAVVAVRGTRELRRVAGAGGEADREPVGRGVIALEGAAHEVGPLGTGAAPRDRVGDDERVSEVKRHRKPLQSRATGCADARGPSWSAIKNRAGNRVATCPGAPEWSG